MRRRPDEDDPPAEGWRLAVAVGWLVACLVWLIAHREILGGTT